MAEKYRHYYVPQALVRNWAADGKHASLYNPMTQKKIENGGIKRFFHENLPDIPELVAKTIDYLDIFFEDLLPVFLSGDVDCLKLDNMISPREVIIFMLTRAPLPVYSPEIAVNRLTYSIGYIDSSSSRKELKEKMRSFEVDRAFAHMTVYGLELLDMDAVILSAPEGSSFLLGAISVSSINPYFSSDMPSSYPGIQSFEMWGSVLILPLTPNKALCIYDSETYTVDAENGICELRKKDVDTLNSVAIYNSNNFDGVLHISGEEYINVLYNNLDAEDFYRTGPFNAEYDEYPFDTNLSVLKVTETAEKERDERKMSLLREYNQRLLDYDEKNLEKINGLDRINECYKRYQYAVKTLKSLKKKRTKNK